MYDVINVNDIIYDHEKFVYICIIESLDLNLGRLEPVVKMNEKINKTVLTLLATIRISNGSFIGFFYNYI